MKRLSAALIGVALILASGCHRRESEICRSSPPENSEQYESWETALSAAHCQHLPGDQPASANLSHVDKGADEIAARERDVRFPPFSAMADPV